MCVAGMAEIAKERQRTEEAMAEEKAAASKPKKWSDGLNKPNVDYSYVMQ